MNKTIFVIISSFPLICSTVSAQDSIIAKYVQDLRTKYAVPDAPAFNILGQNPSNVLNPASVKDIAVEFSSFLGNDLKLTIPKSFAIEISPGLVIGGKKLSLEQYRKIPWLYRLRLSLATNRPDDASTVTNLAVGLRVTLNDESDLRTNQDYVNDAIGLARAIQDSIVTVKKRLGAFATQQQIDSDSQFQEAKNSLENKFQAKWGGWTQEKWNKDITEIAFAAETSSKDSLAKNLVLNKISFWFSSAFGIADWGRVLIGANVKSYKDSSGNKFNSEASLASLFYCGNNDFKFYLEIEGDIIKESKPKWLFNSGIELKAYENIWAEFTAGIIDDCQLNQSSIVTNVKLKYGI